MRRQRKDDGVECSTALVALRTLLHSFSKGGSSRQKQSKADRCARQLTSANYYDIVITSTIINPWDLVHLSLLGVHIYAWRLVVTWNKSSSGSRATLN